MLLLRLFSLHLFLITSQFFGVSSSEELWGYLAFNYSKSEERVLLVLKVEED